MESVAESSDPPSYVEHKFATLLGTLIALITLILPIYVIGYYSSSAADDAQPSQAVDSVSQVFTP